MKFAQQTQNLNIVQLVLKIRTIEYGIFTVTNFSNCFDNRAVTLKFLPHAALQAQCTMTHHVCPSVRLSRA